MNGQLVKPFIVHMLLPYSTDNHFSLRLGQVFGAGPQPPIVAQPMGGPPYDISVDFLPATLLTCWRLDIRESPGFCGSSRVACWTA